jgi:hypothetical protein
MIEVGLKAGDIFTWQNYPLFMNEFKSQRWLLYLGNQTIEALVYQVSTTTQLYHYQDGGSRNKKERPYKKFSLNGPNFYPTE